MYFPSFLETIHKGEYTSENLSLNAHYTDITEHSYQAVKVAKIPLLSFFTGAGFLDIGFVEAGFDVIWRNEYNPFFIKGFEYAMSTMMGPYFDGRVHNTASIVDIEPKQVAREAFNNVTKPEIFGIIGGPPCPDFCIGGKNRGIEG